MNKTTLFLFLLIGISLFSVCIPSSVHAVDEFQITISENIVEGGTTNPDTGVHLYDSGEEVTLTAYPANGYIFLGWLRNSQTMIQINPYTFHMYANYTYEATYQTGNVTLTIIHSDYGDLSLGVGSYEVAYGTTLNITAYPNSGYNLYNWAFNGGIDQGLVGVNPISVYMDRDIELYPIFTEYSIYIVEIVVGTNGHTNLNVGNYYVRSDNPYFPITAIPDAGYKFSSWLINGTITNTNNPLNLLINGDTTIQPVFVASTGLFPGTIFDYVAPGVIIGALGLSFSQIGDRLGEHTYSGFLIGGAMGLLICANAGLIPIWFTTVVFMCGMIALFFWVRSGN